MNIFNFCLLVPTVIFPFPSQEEEKAIICVRPSFVKDVASPLIEAWPHSTPGEHVEN